MKKELEIFNTINKQHTPVSSGILDSLEEEILSEQLFRDYIKETLNESEVKFSGILKLMPSASTSKLIENLIVELPQRAVVLPVDKWHVTLIHQSILKPYRKEFKLLEKGQLLPAPPSISIVPSLDRRVSEGKESWVVWVKNQDELKSYVNKVMEIVGGQINPEPTRVFHISVANLTGNPGDSVR